MPFTIIRNDITKLKVSIIVNAANSDLRMGGGVSGAILNAAGSALLQAACDKLAPIKEGEVAITRGYKLPAKYIIHAVGPIYRDGKQNEEALLRSCYINSLKLAVRRNCKSIAFPLISSGTYGYPKAEALRVATDTIRDFLRKKDLDVTLVLFDKETLAASEVLLGEVRSYIDDHYVDVHQIIETTHFGVGHPPLPDAYAATRSASIRQDLAPITKPSIEDLVGNLDEPFSATLMRLIDASGKKDSEIYRRANIDRRLFSKIRSIKNYAPSKPTVLALAIALELDLNQSKDLLERAGFALSHSRKFDVIVEYFIQSRKYDVFEINEVLFSYDQALLGGSM